jgi:hypothetical protein
LPVVIDVKSTATSAAPPMPREVSATSTEPSKLLDRALIVGARKDALPEKAGPRGSSR